MGLRFNGKKGISARLIIEKIKKEASRGKKEDKRKIKILLSQVIYQQKI